MSIGPIELNYGDIVWYKGEDVDEGYGVVTSKFESAFYRYGVKWIAVRTTPHTPHKKAFQEHSNDPEPCDYWLLRDGKIKVIGRASD